MNEYYIEEIANQNVQYLQADSLKIDGITALFYKDVKCGKDEIIGVFDTTKYAIRIVEPEPVKSKKEIIKELKKEVKAFREKAESYRKDYFQLRNKLNIMSIWQFKSWRGKRK